ncbi:TPA: hypothetical protein ACF5HI_004132 [Salmonella enterica]
MLTNTDEGSELMKMEFSDSEIEIIKISVVGIAKFIAFVSCVICAVLSYIGIVWLIGHGFLLISQYNIYTFRTVLSIVVGVLVLLYIFAGICVSVAEDKYHEDMKKFDAKAEKGAKWNRTNTEKKTFRKLLHVFGVVLLTLFFGMLIMSGNLPENMMFDPSIVCSYIALIAGGALGTVTGTWND